MREYTISIDRSSQPVVITDLDGKIIEFNKQFIDITGYSAEIPHEHISELRIDFQSPNPIMEEWGKIDWKKPSQVTKGILTKPNGEKINITVEKVIVESENQLFIATVIMNVTKYKKAKELLKENEFKYKALFNSNPGYIVYFDNKGKIIMGNEAFERDFSNDLNIIKAVTLEGIGTFIREKTDSSREKVFKLMAQLSAENHIIGKFTFKNGEIHWYQCYMIPLESNGKLMGYQGIGRDVTDLKVAEKELQQLIKEKDSLLREVHHRVKNNLQIISSLHNMRTNYVKEEETINILKDAQTRIKALAGIHEKLYHSSDITHISIKDYLESLIYDLFHVYNIDPEQIKLITEISDIKLNLETAMPCGLIVNELTANSLKYAFPPGKKGTFTVKLKLLEDSMHMTVRDTGIGLSTEDYLSNRTLGFQLVKSLTKQLDGQIELDNSHGTKFNIIFKEAKYKQRIN